MTTEEFAGYADKRFEFEPANDAEEAGPTLRCDGAYVELRHMLATGIACFHVGSKREGHYTSLFSIEKAKDTALGLAKDEALEDYESRLEDAGYDRSMV